MTPSWSSFTRGSADRGLRLTAEPASLGPELGLVLEMGLGLELELEDSCSDDIFSLGLGADDDESDDDEGLGVKELGLLVDSLEMGLGMSPELRLGLELL